MCGILRGHVCGCVPVAKLDICLALFCVLGASSGGECLDLTAIWHGPGKTQEIPASFTAETCWPCVEECALVTSISTLKEWPLQIRRRPSMHGGISHVSIGGGWAKFVADQHLGDGALLTFEPVDERHLVVAFHQRGALEEPQHLEQLEPLRNTLVRDCRDNEAPEVDNPQPVLTAGRAEVRSDKRPHFTKILRKTHLQKLASTRIVSANLNSADICWSLCQSV